MIRGICSFVLATACSGESKPAEPARRVPESAPAPSPRASAPPAVAPDLGQLVDIAADGQRALLYDLAPVVYRVVAIDANNVERELPLPAIEAYPDEQTDKPLADELLAIGELIASFPRRSAAQIAASVDGKRVAFPANIGDRSWLMVATGGAQLAKLPYPLFAVFAPDGKTLFVQREVSSSERTGPVWELEARAGDGTGKPRSISGTRGVQMEFVATPAELRLVLSPDPLGETCFVAVAWAAPQAVKRLGCVPGGERLLGCVLSPAGTWAACSTQDPAAQPRTRTLDLTAGTPGLDVSGPATRFAVSDDGTLVRYNPEAKQLVINDPTGAARASVPYTHGGSAGRFRNARDLVVVERGRLLVLDVTR